MKVMVRGFLFTFRHEYVKEVLRRGLVATSRVYGPVVIRVKPGDLVFIHDMDKDVLYGVFAATSYGWYNIDPRAFGGKYPYQVKFTTLGEVVEVKNASKVLEKYGFTPNTIIGGRRLSDFLSVFVGNTLLGIDEGSSEVARLREVLRSGNDIEVEEVPVIEATTLWDFPRQSYGVKPKGDNKYPGVTPAQVIFNLIWRYTKPGDLVVDPMAGSGTTCDVAEEEGRRAVCLDIAPPRRDEVQADARLIPLPDSVADLVFVDSPYGDNIMYNNHPGCLCLPAESEVFYEELENVMRECLRVLKPGGVLGWLIGDQWVRDRFTPVGFKVFERLIKYFEPIDIVAVVRRNQTSNTEVWMSRARRMGFFLRGFKYLFIMRKPTGTTRREEGPRKIRWNVYPREKHRESKKKNTLRKLKNNFS